MTRHLRPPASAPALVKALGSLPVELTVAGTLVPTDEHGSVVIRRRKGVRDALGEPATCSVSINVDAPPSWRKGDRVVVEAGDTALTAVFGVEFLASNYTNNPSMEVNSTGWATISGAPSHSVARTTATFKFGAAALRYTSTAARGAAVGMFRGTASSTAAPGERWSGRFSTRSAGVWSTLVRAQLVALAADNLTELGVVAEAVVNSSGSAYADRLVPNVAANPAGTASLRWKFVTADEMVAGQAHDFDGFVSHPSATPPTEYVDGTLVPPAGISYRWDGTAHASPSHKFVTGTPEKWAAARYRFVGRLSDLKLKTGRTGPATAQLVAVGTSATAARVDVGDAPWAAETVTTRADRILAAVAAADPTIPVTTLTATPGPVIAPRDVDSQPAASLLGELGPIIDPRAGLVERRSGELVFGKILDATFDPLDLPSNVVEQGLEHDTAPRVNDVTVELGKPLDTTLMFTNVCPNPSFEVDTTGWVNRLAAITRDTTLAYHGAASLKVTPTAGANGPGAYTSWAEAAGDRWAVRMRVYTPVAGNYQISLQHFDGASAIITSETPPDYVVPANTWTELVFLSAAAPSGSAATRLYILRNEVSTAAMVCYIDAVSVYNRADLGADTLGYFDGSTAAGNYTYSWAGTAGKSASLAKANTNTPGQLYRYTDAASVAAYGPYASKVTLPTNWAAPRPMYAHAQTRATAELLSGGWQLPPARVDLLPLLDGRRSALNPTVPTATTPLELAGRLLRAELGSLRTIRYPGGVNPAHVPTIHAVTGPVTVLDETITAHRWVIETESERTT